MNTTTGSKRMHLAHTDDGWVARPLESVILTGAPGATLVVTDGEGRAYQRLPAAPVVEIPVAGSLGQHTISALNDEGAVLETLAFTVDAETDIQDAGGAFHDLLAILHRTMCCYSPTGTGSITWRGDSYTYYVHWILDHMHTAKGMQYFGDATRGLIDLFSQAQREDGMIWSFAFPEREDLYHYTAYAPYRYARRDGGVLFGRQPVENHNEANFVEGLYLGWKGSGDDAWMAAHLDAAIRALNYSVTDRCRWSTRFGLLKRGYTIDSWDFQVKDEYTVPFSLAVDQMIDAERTKFGIFFGDNTGYMGACRMLADMLDAAGRATDAEGFRQRREEIAQRLTDLAWNGRFFTHHVEEDPAIVRDLGVDARAQIAMSNAYSINRGITHEQSAAILATYQDLQAHLPDGAPGEWYAIYPPFERGFGHGGTKWQYMNGGVQLHAAGELARGAFEHGFESYGADILQRVRELALRYDGIAHFAYTGATLPPPPPQVFTPLDLREVANMDLADAGAEGVPGWMGVDPGNDIATFPVGDVTLAGVPYRIADPAANGRRAAAAVSTRDGYPAQIAVPVRATAGAIYLVHAATLAGASGIAVAVTLQYADGSAATQYLQNGKQLCSFWFPAEINVFAGIAWQGSNARCADIGIGWAALTNPHPEKVIERIVFTGSLEGTIYAVLGVTLADRPPYIAPNPISFGGPDNWSGGTCTFALMQGLVGVMDTDRALRQVRLSPRWPAAGVDEVSVTTRYPASRGYLAYRYRRDAAAKTLSLELTGSGDAVELRLLLPNEATAIRGVQVDGVAVPHAGETVEASTYVCLPITLRGLHRVEVEYATD